MKKNERPARIRPLVRVIGVLGVSQHPDFTLPRLSRLSSPGRAMLRDPDTTESAGETFFSRPNARKSAGRPAGHGGTAPPGQGAGGGASVRQGDAQEIERQVRSGANCG